MHRKTVAIVAATAVVGGIFAAGAPAFADTDPNPDNIAVQVTDPVTLTMSLDSHTLALNAKVNVDDSHMAPSNPSHPVAGNPTTGGIGIVTTSDNSTGYVVQVAAPAGGFADSDGKSADAMPDNILHLQYLNIGGPASNQVTPVESTLDNPVNVITQPGLSGAGQVSDDQDSGNASPAGQDSKHVGFWINPDSLLGGHSYSGSLTVTLIPNP